MLALAPFFANPSKVWAASDVSSADLQAEARAIGFLNGLPSDGKVTVGIVFADIADGKAKAMQAATLLGIIPGLNKATFRTVLIAAKDFAQTTERLDAVILMPNQGLSSNEMATAVRRRRVVSISTDPNCIDTKCCVLMVQTGRRVRIVLDTTLADAVGAKFSSIFMMMVERR